MLSGVLWQVNINVFIAAFSGQTGLGHVRLAPQLGVREVVSFCHCNSIHPSAILTYP